VHSFLEHWGLINFMVNPDINAPIPVAPSPLSSISSDTTALAQQMIKLDTPQPEAPPNLSLRKNVYFTNVAPPQVLRIHMLLHVLNAFTQCVCASCNQDCTKNRYHAEKENMDLCISCYASGKYPEHFNSSDFTRIDASVTDVGEWTDQETLLLLEVCIYDMSDMCNTRDRH
jgi:SWI/SNF related-matrix-associated actin-dependent regulator of chromatin subfamily C